MSGNGSKCRTERVLPPGMAFRARSLAVRLFGLLAAYRSRARPRAASTDKLASGFAMKSFVAQFEDRAGQHFHPGLEIRHFHMLFWVMAAVRVADQQNGGGDPASLKHRGVVPNRRHSIGSDAHICAGFFDGGLESRVKVNGRRAHSLAKVKFDAVVTRKFARPLDDAV